MLCTPFRIAAEPSNASMPEAVKIFECKVQSSLIPEFHRIKPAVRAVEADYGKFQCVRQPARFSGNDGFHIAVQEKLRGIFLFLFRLEKGKHRAISPLYDLLMKFKNQSGVITVLRRGQRHTDRVRAPPAQVRGRPVQPESGRGRLLPDPLLSRNPVADASCRIRSASSGRTRPLSRLFSTSETVDCERFSRFASSVIVIAIFAKTPLGDFYCVIRMTLLIIPIFPALSRAGVKLSEKKAVEEGCERCGFL